MSTQECFERHLEKGRCHEECGRMLTEDAFGMCLRTQPLAIFIDPPPKATVMWLECEKQRALKAVRCAVTQHKLAMREYRDAARLRPRNVETKQRLHLSHAATCVLESLIEAPVPRSLGRFLAHYNLSIRYWDLGKATQAIQEADMARHELQVAGLPGGCADHNRTIMERVHGRYVKEERRLLGVLKKSPNALNSNYKLGVLYFDKRMLLRAESQLKKTEECARTALARQNVEFERQKQVSMDIPNWLAAEDRKFNRLSNLLDNIQKDRKFLSELRELWCVEATGGRDGARPQLLPCLYQRGSQGVSVPCEAWCDDLSTRTDIDLAPPQLPKAVCLPSRVGYSS